MDTVYVVMHPSNVQRERSAERDMQVDREPVLTPPNPAPASSFSSNHHSVDREPTPKSEIVERDARADLVATSRVVTSAGVRDVNDAVGQASNTQRSRSSLPMGPQSSVSLDRPLTISDALAYLDAVKAQFRDQFDVYNDFLDIVKDFKHKEIDTPGVINRIVHLFQEHPALIQGFNMFLPVGYRIECSISEAGFVTVTTHSGQIIQTTTPAEGGQALSWSIEPARPEAVAQGESALQYLRKVKLRCGRDTYWQFIDIIWRYYRAPDPDDEAVWDEIIRLFEDAPDLRDEFRAFLPDRSDLCDEEKNLHNVDAVTSFANMTMSLAASVLDMEVEDVAH